MGTNPFATLFSTENIAKPQENAINALSKKVNDFLENVFLLTNDKTNKKRGQLVFVQIETESGLLTLESVEQVLFDRLVNLDELLSYPENRETSASEALERSVVKYLFQCYKRNFSRSQNRNDTVLKDCSAKVQDLILTNLSTAIKTPDLFEGQDLSQQILEIVIRTFEDDEDVLISFIPELVKAMMADPEEAAGNFALLEALFKSTFTQCVKSLKNASLLSVEKWILPFLNIFVVDKSTARLLLKFSTPNSTAAGYEGAQFSESLLGALLCLSILPKTSHGPYEYYDDPTNLSSIDLTTSTLWNHLKLMLDSMAQLFKSILVFGGQLRTDLLLWIGNCLHANSARGQMGHSISPLLNIRVAPDSFMINLANVLLRLSRPLLKPQLKVMSVDPTYTWVKDEESEAANVHMKGVNKETCLLPMGEDERVIAASYNFVTELFFMTHKAIDLSYRVCIEKLIKMNRELNRLRSAYQDTVQQPGGQDLAENLLKMLKSQSQQFLSLKKIISEPTNDELLLQFYESTAIWLTELSTTEKSVDKTNKAIGFAPLTVGHFELPAKNKISDLLKSVPEFILENIVEYLQFSRHRESPAIQDLANYEAQSSLFTFILLLMGSAERVKNPHLRARLADGLESLLPKEEAVTMYQLGSRLFTSHEWRLQIVPNLLRVFVSIEMTGSSVNFEQKFNYRRPMYQILFFTLKLDEQKQGLLLLENEAMLNMDAVDPPLYLKFVNLLINDAIFLLDEALSNLMQIKQLQSAQDNGEWNDLPEAERRQNQSNLQHLGMLAKFDNILGRDTINLLTILTAETKRIFCHSTMVDRVANFLNYFLLHLVGPKKGDYKVKDKKEYEFDPKTTVLHITQIYINLENCEEFCLAVSQDGRSYSPQLFDFAIGVLARIGGGALMTDLKEFSEKVQRLEKKKQEDDEILTDVPEEFLDPILGVLMTDPVILPVSQITLDRSTLLRHFLSDQTDPFNRSPLTMEEVKPNNEIKQQIADWIKSKRDAHNSLKESTDE